MLAPWPDVSALAALVLPSGAEWGALLLSYLLGAVPFGWVMARGLKGVDLRQVGSGNIGATNAMRVLGRPLGVLAFLLDFGKGLVPVLWIATGFAAEPERLEALRSLQVLCGASAVCGHVWPVYLGFRGGKAVATGCGALTALDPWIFLCGGIVWLLFMGAFRYTGLASMAMGVTFPLAAWWRMAPERLGGEVVIGASALTLLILVRHRSNIARMRAGTEPKVGRKRGAESGG